jgi:hypothetical protein
VFPREAGAEERAAEATADEEADADAVGWKGRVVALSLDAAGAVGAASSSIGGSGVVLSGSLRARHASTCATMAANASLRACATASTPSYAARWSVIES